MQQNSGVDSRRVFMFTLSSKIASLVTMVRQSVGCTPHLLHLAHSLLLLWNPEKAAHVHPVRLVAAGSGTFLPFWHCTGTGVGVVLLMPRCVQPVLFFLCS